MRELSLHILDLVQNSIEAGATQVDLDINEDDKTNRLTIRVSDNGRGMDESIKQKVIDPFITSRKTRKVGLGLPLIDMSTRRCGGFLLIESAIGKGTVIEAVYQLNHLDRPPLGKMAESIKTIIVANPNLKFSYRHRVNGCVFGVESKDIIEELGDVPLTHPEVITWLTSYLTEGVESLYGGVKNEDT